MKNFPLVIGIALILAGSISLAYQGITYKTQEDVVKIGELKITAETTERIPLPPILGGAAILAGIILIYVGRKK